MYRNKSLTDATLEEILEELENRSYDYKKCFLAEALEENRIDRESILAREIKANDTTQLEGPTGWMFDWVRDGRNLRYKSFKFVKGFLDREKSDHVK